MNTVAIETQVRESVGKKSSKGLRKAGNIPCNLFGGKENFSFSSPLKSLRGVIYTPDFTLASITINGTEHKAVVKELQFNPVNDALIHVDFLELTNGKTVILDVPVKLKGSPIGVREGGKLYQKVRSIKVRTKPEFLTGELEIDVTNLSLGKTIRVGDLKYPNLELLLPGNIPVAAVTIPRLMKEEVAAPVAAVATAVAGAPAEGAAAGAAAPAAGAKPEAKKEEKKK